MIAVVLGCNSNKSEEKQLLLYTGAGLRPPVAELAELFARQHKIRVECDYAGSEVLLSRIKLTNRGDLYMPGDVHYVDMAEDAGLVGSKSTVCYFVPAIVVQKGNPKNIHALTDLTRSGVKIGLGDPKACAIGRKCCKIFAKNNISEEAIAKHVVFRSLTVTELINNIKLGTLDAVIVWDAVAAFAPNETEIVHIPTQQNIISTVAIGTLKSSQYPKLAAQFVDFITSEQAKEVFKKHHYTVAEPK